MHWRVGQRQQLHEEQRDGLHGRELGGGHWCACVEVGINARVEREDGGRVA